MSAERLREAAAKHRATDSGQITEVVAAWLEAEASHFEHMAAKATALNFLIAASDASGQMRDWRINLGYNTLTEALAVADAILAANGDAS